MKKTKHKQSNLIDFLKSSQFVLILSAEVIAGVAIVLTALSIFLKLGDDVLDKEVISFDFSIIRYIYSFRNPLMTTVMNIISFFGGELFLGGAIMVTIFILLRKHKKNALVFSFILLFGIILNLALKNLFERPRPQLHPLVHETSYSFPSGHSMNSFVFYFALSYFIFLNKRNIKLGIILTIFSSILVLLIGISRIYLGAHFPSDVIAGYVAGLCWFVMVLLFEKTILLLRLVRQYKDKHAY